MIGRTASVILLLLFSCILVKSVYPQKLNLLMTPDDRNQFAFSFDKTFYKGQNNISTLTGVYQLSCDVPISSRFNIVGIIPFINFSTDLDNMYYSDDYSKNGPGNIFIGLQMKPDQMDIGGSSITFGAFLPTADEDIASNGVINNYYDILKYMPNSLGLYFNYAFYKISEDGFNYGFEAGPNILIPTRDNGSEGELLIHYAAGAGFRKDIFELNAEFLGIGIVTDDDEDLNERLVHQFSVGSILHFDNVAPKLFYRIYINDHFERLIDGTLGLGVTVSL